LSPRRRPWNGSGVARVTTTPLPVCECRLNPWPSSLQLKSLTVLDECPPARAHGVAASSNDANNTFLDA
jgi:hypothetical protein